MSGNSANFWLTTKDTFDVCGSIAGDTSLSAYFDLADTNVLLALPILGRLSDGTTTALDQLSTNVFHGVNLADGNMMVVLSSTKAVEIHNATLNGGILVVAQTPAELLMVFADFLRVTFVSSEHGVYGKVFRVNDCR